MILIKYGHAFTDIYHKEDIFTFIMPASKQTQFKECNKEMRRKTISRHNTECVEATKTKRPVLVTELVLLIMNDPNSTPGKGGRISLVGIWNL